MPCSDQWVAYIEAIQKLSEFCTIEKLIIISMQYYNICYGINASRVFRMYIYINIILDDYIISLNYCYYYYIYYDLLLHFYSLH